MEIEMKAVINEDQFKTLLNTEDFGFCKTNEIRDFLVKKDTYYSFNGEKISKPKYIQRIREETLVATYNPGKECLVDQIKRREDTGEEVHVQTPMSLFAYAALEFFNFNQTLSGMCPTRTYVTVKEKHTDARGRENNSEYESEVSNRAAIEELYKVMNLKPYFEKDKRSISFYIEIEGKQLHAEIVSVNASDIYLEIEACTDSGANEYANLIMRFFKEALGITKFDGRSWATIIGEAK